MDNGNNCTTCMYFKRNVLNESEVSFFEDAGMCQYNPISIRKNNTDWCGQWESKLEKKKEHRKLISFTRMIEIGMRDYGGHFDHENNDFIVIDPDHSNDRFYFGENRPNKTIKLHIPNMYTFCGDDLEGEALKFEWPSWGIVIIYE